MSACYTLIILAVCLLVGGTGYGIWSLVKDKLVNKLTEIGDDPYKWDDDCNNVFFYIGAVVYVLCILATIGAGLYYLL